MTDHLPSYAEAKKIKLLTLTVTGNSRFLQCPQKQSCGNQLIHRCLTK